ncbi:hypothetical protein VNO77_33333 [Canavalia gladiata]|uniref:Uncharacterized protein n=1 Tax=Canavalia gladiata TaxID=3824 RepID=A0AAN9KC65_CANGL
MLENKALSNIVQMVPTFFPYLETLNLQHSNLTVLPACIEECRFLKTLLLCNCKQLGEIRALPPSANFISAFNCISLKADCLTSNKLWSQAVDFTTTKFYVLPGQRIPEWFDHSSRGKSLCFWFRKNFPAFVVCAVLGVRDNMECPFSVNFDLYVKINGIERTVLSDFNYILETDHIFMYNTFTHAMFLDRGRPLSLNKWNYGEVFFVTPPDSGCLESIKWTGVYVNRAFITMDNVRFTNPYPHKNTCDDSCYSNRDMGNQLTFLCEAPTQQQQHLASFNPAIPMDSDIVDYTQEWLVMRPYGERPLDYGCSNPDSLELEETIEISNNLGHMSFVLPSCMFALFHFVSTICLVCFYHLLSLFSILNGGMDTNLTEKQEEPLVTSIPNKEPMPLKKAKLKNRYLGQSQVPLHQWSVMGKQLGDHITLGEQLNINLTESKLISAESNAEGTLLFNKNQANIDDTRFLLRKDNGQQPGPNAEAHKKIVEAEINEDNLEAFYAFLEAETISLTHVGDTQDNNASIMTRHSEETHKALHILRDFVSKTFSLLLHPGRSTLLKDVLNHLLSLPPDEGISLRTKLVILQLSRSYAQWILYYDNANIKFESATADLSKAERVKDDLEANVKDYREMGMVEKCLCDQLVSLQEKKRDLEDKINAVKAEIEDFTVQRDTVAKRKRELFHKGRAMKAERDDLRNQVPRLKAEKEWAKIIQANIEAEWSKLGEQFIGSTNSEEWI